MERVRETERSGGLGAAVIEREVRPYKGLGETAHAPCKWPTMAITDVAMGDLDAALAADPLFHLCPDGHQGTVDVRYWPFHPLNVSCRHRMARRIGQPVPDR